MKGWWSEGVHVRNDDHDSKVNWKSNASKRLSRPRVSITFARSEFRTRYKQRFLNSVLMLHFSFFFFFYHLNIVGGNEKCFPADLKSRIPFIPSPPRPIQKATARITAYDLRRDFTFKLSVVPSQSFRIYAAASDPERERRVENPPLQTFWER
jgi:hypothetical protein